MLIICLTIIAFAIGQSSSAPTTNETDLWFGRSPNPKYTNLTHLRAKNDQLFAFFDDGVDFWQAANENFVLKKKCPLPNTADISTIDVFPKSNIIVYSLNSDDKALIVFDVDSCKQLWKSKLSQPIDTIFAAKSTISVYYKNNESQLFSWNEDQVEPMKVTAYDPSIADNGEILYRNEDKKEEGYLYNLETKDSKTVSIGFPFNYVRFTPDGSIFVVQDEDLKKFAVVNVDTVKTLFNGSSEGYGELMTVSEDGRFLAFLMVDEKTSKTKITWVKLNLDGQHLSESELVSDISSENDDIFANDMLFRNIRGVPCFQLVSGDGVLNIYEFNELKKEWELLE